MKLSIYKLSILSFLFVSIIACSKEEEPCPNELVPSVRGIFINKAETSPDSMFISTIGLDNQEGFSAEVPEYFFVPLKIDSTKTSFLVAIGVNNGTVIQFTKDTIELQYSSTLKLNDLECGFVTEFAISAVTNTTNMIDSVLIADPNINSKKTDHVKIYF